MARVKKIAQDLNWAYEKNTSYGKYRDYDVSFIQHINYMNSYDNYKLVVIPVEELSQVQVENLHQLFFSRKKEMMVQSFGYTKKTYEFRIFEAFKQMNTERFTRMLDIVLEAFNKYEVLPLKTCVFCGEENPDKMTRMNQIAYPAHSHCLQEAKQEVDSVRSEYNDKPVNMGRGIIGAIFGALIGLIPWVLVSWFTNFYAAILAIVIGYSAFFFYKKFGGKVVKKTKLLIIIVTLIAIVLCNIILASLVILNAEAPLIIDNYIILYADPELGPMLLGDLGLGLLIGSLGLFSVYKKVKSEEFSTSIE